MIHELKIRPQFLDQIISGRKTFEIRKNDRNFKEGHIVELLGYVEGKGYTGIMIRKKIGYISEFEQKDGYVVFSLLDLERTQ